jgi:hypothetical protein
VTRGWGRVPLDGDGRLLVFVVVVCLGFNALVLLRGL